MPNININIPLYFTGITTHIPLYFNGITILECNIYIYIYTELAPKLSATASVAQLVERCSRVQRARVQFPAEDLECIFRNWSRLGLKMYIFLTLEFTTHYFNFHLLKLYLLQERAARLILIKSKYWNSLGHLVSFMHFVLLAWLRTMRLVLAHSDVITSTPQVELSANKNGSQFSINNGKSLIKTKNNNPRIDPWGTPDLIGRGSEVVVFDLQNRK